MRARAVLQKEADAEFQALSTEELNDATTVSHRCLQFATQICDERDAVLLQADNAVALAAELQNALTTAESTVSQLRKA
eukprot:SAG31_NODE_3374_length_4350_cov_4.769162_5_plen_79_part_00